MTTVAWDGRYLAADGRSVTGSSPRASRAQKLGLILPERPKGPYIMGKTWEGVGVAAGTCGERGDCDEYLQWLKDVRGDDKAKWPFPAPNGDEDNPSWVMDSIEIRFTLKSLGDRWESRLLSLRGRDPKGRLITMADPDEIMERFAMGSGGDYAFGALEVGATAMDAVVAASALDLHTGGQISFIDTQRIDKGIQVLEEFDDDEE